jgi:chemotaxis methyl-accepting protein methylase
MRQLSSHHREAVQQLISRYYGFWVKEEWMDKLWNKMGHRMHVIGVTQFNEYWSRLQGPDGASGELFELVQELLNHDSQFMRNPEQLELLKTEVLPTWKTTIRSQPRRLASLGCSTGEEPYSLAITVEEALGSEAADAVTVVGFDLSRRAVASARAGKYDAFRLRDILPADRARYFSEQPGGAWQIQPRFQRRVNFFEHNLMHPLPLAFVDVVFCCNVLIYFRPVVVREILKRIHASLKPDGLLFLGYADSALDLASHFRQVTRQNTTYYQRLSAPEETGRSNPLLPLSHEPAAQQP